MDVVYRLLRSIWLQFAAQQLCFLLHLILEAGQTHIRRDSVVHDGDETTFLNERDKGPYMRVNCLGALGSTRLSMPPQKRSGLRNFLRRRTRSWSAARSNGQTVPTDARVHVAASRTMYSNRGRESPRKVINSLGSIPTLISLGNQFQCRDVGASPSASHRS